MSLSTIVNSAFWLVGIGAIVTSLVALRSILRGRQRSQHGDVVFAGARHELLVTDRNVSLTVNLSAAIEPDEFSKLLARIKRLTARRQNSAFILWEMRKELDLMKSHESELTGGEGSSLESRPMQSSQN